MAGVRSEELVVEEDEDEDKEAERKEIPGLDEK